MSSCPPPPINNKEARGFSLLEMLVAMVIISICSAAAYAIFAQGLTLWRRTSGWQLEDEADLVFDRVAGDLRNALLYSEKPLSGGHHKLEFYAVLPPGSTVGKNPGPRETWVAMPAPARIRYLFDPSSRRLVREETPYPDLLLPGGRGRTVIKTAGEHVADWKVEYYDKGRKGQDFAWRSRWESPCLPRAVRMSLRLDDNKTIRPLERIVALKVTYCPASETPEGVV